MQLADSFAHNCYRRNVEPDHDVPLHSAIVCDKVVMPIEWFYFCNMTCLQAYTAVKEQHGITDLMPDDGPGDQLVGSFQLPARRRPGGKARKPRATTTKRSAHIFLWKLVAGVPSRC